MDQIAVELPIAPTEWPADRVERRAVAELIPYARNSRTHSAEQVEQLAVSLKKFGWTVPVLVDEAGVLIAGHGRVLAALRLGIVEVPTVVARGWSEEAKAAYRIADNKLALNAGWDTEMLALELASLKSEGFDLTLTAFNSNEIDQLFASETDTDAEWQGMPEFDQQDKKAFQSFMIHFKDQAAVDQFANLIAQKITDKTRYVWFPTIEIERHADKRYAHEPEVSDLHRVEGESG